MLHTPLKAPGYFGQPDVSKMGLWVGEWEMILEQHNLVQRGRRIMPYCKTRDQSCNLMEKGRKVIYV